MTRNCGQNPSPCPPCDFGPFTRNHYFTGKLMLEQDFNVEQRYGMEKLRHHNAHLHGWGVVCGLKIVAHPNPACRSRFVCVEPGTAVDCCGHDILVRETDCIDITQLAAVQALAGTTGAHTLQLCIRYRECPTEPVPVLYDECGCDENRCAPNRVLEAYAVDAIVDPPDAAASPGSPKFNWSSTLSPGGASAAALYAGSPGFLYAISATQNTIFQLESTHYSVLGTAALTAPATALAVSGDGKFVCAVVGSTAPRQLLVFDTTDLSKPALQSVAIPSDTAANPIQLATAGDQLLLLLNTATAPQLQVWPLSSASTPPIAPAVIDLTTLTTQAGVAVVASTDGTLAYVVDAGGNLFTADLAAATAANLGVAAGFAPTAMALVTSSGGDALAVAGASQLVLVTLGAAPAVLAPVALAAAAVAVAAAPDGKWAYVLEQSPAPSTDCAIQAVNLFDIQQNQPATVTAGFPVGAGSKQIIVSATGRTLLVPFEDQDNAEQPGGIAVIDVAEAACGDLLSGCCPGCCEPNCVVLATIANYHAGDSIEDPTNPPAATAAAGTATINNATRRLLPSVQALFDYVRCMLGQSGGTGPQGPPGPAGKSYTPLALPHIVAINWTHGETLTIGEIEKMDPGLVIAFDTPVLASTLTSETVQLKVKKIVGTSYQMIGIVGKVLCGNVPVPSCGSPLGEFTASSDPTVNAVAFDPAPLLKFAGSECWVILKGDFILGPITQPDGTTVNRALDANHFAPGLGNPSARCPTGDGIEGGTFESWFMLPASERARTNNG